jgi:SAM-dependent methyltransferase
VPVLIDLSMRNKHLRPYRERAAAEGRVLDVGIGSGLNLPFFGQQAREVFGLDPSSRLLAWARDQTQHTQVHVHLLEGLARLISARLAARTLRFPPVYADDCCSPGS